MSIGSCWLAALSCVGAARRGASATTTGIRQNTVADPLRPGAAADALACHSGGGRACCGTGEMLRSTPDLDLRDWLLERARLQPAVAERVLRTLEQEEVMDVADLRVLRGLPRFAECLKAVTAAKIAAALDERCDAEQAPQTPTTPPRTQTDAPCRRTAAPRELSPPRRGTLFGEEDSMEQDVPACLTELDAVRRIQLVWRRHRRAAPATSSAPTRTRSRRRRGRGGRVAPSTDNGQVNGAQRPGQPCPGGEATVMQTAGSSTAYAQGPARPSTPRCCERHASAPERTATCPPWKLRAGLSLPDDHLPYLFRKERKWWESLELYDVWLRGGKLDVCEHGCEHCGEEGCDECLGTGCSMALDPEGQGWKSYYYVNDPCCEAGRVYAVLYAYILPKPGDVLATVKTAIDLRQPPDSPSVRKALDECKLAALPSTREAMRIMVAHGQADFNRAKSYEPGRRFGMTLRQEGKYADAYEREVHAREKKALRDYYSDTDLYDGDEEARWAADSL